MRWGGAYCHIKGAVHNEPVLGCMMGKKEEGASKTAARVVVFRQDWEESGTPQSRGRGKQKDGRREMAEGWCAEVAGSEKRFSRRGS